MRILVGVDVGGSTTSGGLVTPEGEILSVIQAPTHRNGLGTGVETLEDVVGELLAQARARDLTLEGIGVGIPGPVDVEKGMMLVFPNLVPEFGGVPIADRLATPPGVPIFVDNDVRAQALGEWTFGRGRGATSLVLLAIGSGLGGGIIVDGHLVRGYAGYGGELGHVPVKFDGPPCVCGGRGCLAVYLSGAMMAARARERAAEHPESALLTLVGGDGARLTTATVYQAAKAGDPVAAAMVEEACEALGASLGGIANALNPEMIVVTGGVAASLIPLEQEILRHAAHYALAGALGGTRIHFVASDKRSTVLGGAALVRYETRARAGTPCRIADGRPRRVRPSTGR